MLGLSLWTRPQNLSFLGSHPEIFTKPVTMKATSPALESKWYSFTYKNEQQIKPHNIIHINIIWSVGRERRWSLFPSYTILHFLHKNYSLLNSWFPLQYSANEKNKKISWFRNWQHTTTFLSKLCLQQNFKRSRWFHHYKKKRNLIFPSNFLTVLEERIYNASI